jgi:aryl-alcohol dehydrogenase-like predicted oxidoreductase
MFEPDDHRHFNRHGEQFDKGETFSGVPVNEALPAIDELRAVMPHGWTFTQSALRWILMWNAVTCTIPGAKTASQVRENASAADLPRLTRHEMAAVKRIYDSRIRPLVHQSW